MEYLVRSIKNGYCVIKDNIDNIKKDDDLIEIILSWEDGKRMDKLKEHFSSIKRNKEDIEIQVKKNYNKKEFEDYMHYCYVKDRCILSDLIKLGIINKEETEELEKLNEEAENKQIVLINNCFNARRTLKIGFFHR